MSGLLLAHHKTQVHECACKARPVIVRMGGRKRGITRDLHRCVALLALEVLSELQSVERYKSQTSGTDTICHRIRETNKKARASVIIIQSRPCYTFSPRAGLRVTGTATMTDANQAGLQHTTGMIEMCSNACPEQVAVASGSSGLGFTVLFPPRLWQQ